MYLFQHCDAHGISKSNWCTVNDNSVIQQLSISLLFILSLSLLLWTGGLRARRLITGAVLKPPVACAAVNC